MTTRAAFTEADLSRAVSVAAKQGWRVRVIDGGRDKRAEIVIEPTKDVDTSDGPDKW